ncbi:MAG: hypothetical protein ACRCZY_06770 [Phocaeicola sp.]
MKTREDIKAMLNLKVDAQYLGLTRRAVSSLLNCDFEYLHEIIKVGKHKFRGTLGIGTSCFTEVNEIIERFGLTWDIDVAEYLKSEKVAVSDLIWEQRRYELARNAMKTYHFIDDSGDIEAMAEYCVNVADELIKQLKK